MKRDSVFSLVEQPLIAAGHKEPAAGDKEAKEENALQDRIIRLPHHHHKSRNWS